MIELFQVREGRRLGLLGLGGRFQVGQQAAKLSPPVAHVIGANDVVSNVLEHSNDGVANDGGPQMTDVHLLSEVRRAVVDDEGARCGDFWLFR